jgi:hypothetical protein
MKYRRTLCDVTARSSSYRNQSQWRYEPLCRKSPNGAVFGLVEVD